MGMVKGYMRLLEVVLVIFLMLAFSMTLLQMGTKMRGQKKRTQTIQRISEDCKNMICNSDRDRKLVFSSRSLQPMNESLKYSTEKDVRFQVVMMNTTDDTVIKKVGYDLPPLSGLEAEKSVATSSCILSHETKNPRKVVVQLWR